MDNSTNQLSRFQVVGELVTRQLNDLKIQTNETLINICRILGIITCVSSYCTFDFSRKGTLSILRTCNSLVLVERMSICSPKYQSYYFSLNGISYAVRIWTFFRQSIAITHKFITRVERLPSIYVSNVSQNILLGWVETRFTISSAQRTNWVLLFWHAGQKEGIN